MARGLNVYLEVMIKGLERLIKAGDYDQEQIERWQRGTKLALKRQSIASRYEVARRTGAEIYGPDHPYATTGIERPDTVDRIGRDVAYAFKEKHYTAKNGTIIVAGNFDAAAAESAIRANFGEWSGGHEDTAITAPTAKRTAPTYIGIPSEESATVTLRIAYPGPMGSDKDTATRMVLAEMLTLRMSDLREKLGSSYGTRAGYATRVGPGMYLIEGPVDAARAGESLAAMRAGIESLRKGENFAEDFARARRMVLEDLLAEATDSFSLARQLTSLVTLDLPLDHYDTLVRKVANLAPEEVMLLIAKDLKAEGEVVIAHGPKDALKKAFADAGIQNAKLVE
jgi:predicted Zn-dependent peptidase